MDNSDKAQITELDRITLKVRDQLANIYQVNPREAFDIAIAHARVFNLMTATGSASDGDYVNSITEVFRIFKVEGLNARAQSNVNERQ